jgi:hypothetical protein
VFLRLVFCQILVAMLLDNMLLQISFLAEGVLAIVASIGSFTCVLSVVDNDVQVSGECLATARPLTGEAVRTPLVHAVLLVHFDRLVLEK